MNILVLNWQDRLNPLAGGAEVHLHEIFSRIARRGHAVTLFCSSFPGALPEEMVDGIRVIRRGGRNTFNFTLAIEYLTRLRHLRYDVVVDDINKIPFFTPLFVRRPLVGIVHHLFGKTIFVETGFVPALYVYLAERLLRPVYGKTPIAVVSESTRHEMEALGFRPGQLSEVKNCVDHDVYRVTDVPKSPTPLIGYLGRLKKYKSVGHLLEAFALVRKELADVRLIVVGSGDDQARLEAIAAGLKIQDAVTFTGFVSTEEKVRLLQKMWFVANPSSKEGWGLTVIEANACGTPCIASDVPGLRDSVVENKTGMLYLYGDIRGLANGMKELLNNSKKLEAMRKEAIHWAGNFDWNAEAAKMEQLLIETIGN